MEHGKISKEKYQLQKSGQSASEPDLATANGSRGLHSKHPGFPPGFTVDELKWYRKKKPPGEWGPRDNLKTEEGSMKKFKTEYKRRFKQFKFFPASSQDLTESLEDLVEKRKLIRPINYLKLEGDLEHHPEYRDLFVEFPVRREERFHEPPAHLQLEGLMNVTTEQQEKYVPFQTATRAQIVKRSAAFNPEGDEFMVNSSEMRSQFVKHEPTPRSELTRRPTSLKLEGEMATRTEMRDKFTEVDCEHVHRPKLVKKPTNLKLEGELDVKTEKNEKFVPFDLPQRIPLTKQGTNLHLEGPMEIQTEQKNQFVPYNIEEQTKKEKDAPFELSKKQTVTRRPTNLQLSGDLQIQSENSAQYVPLAVQKRPPLAKKDTNLHLEGDLAMKPEYREQFVEYHTERSKPKRPVNNLGLHIDDEMFKDKKRDTFFDEYQKPFRFLDSKENQLKNPKQNLKSDDLKVKLQADGNIDSIAEYKNSFVDFPRGRPVLKRPKESLRAEGHVSHLSEKSAAYIPHPGASRPSLARREDSLGAGCVSMEKNCERFECQPEYRRAYIDYLQRENLERKSRTIPADSDTSSLSRIPLPTSKRHSSKSPTSSTKSRSVSPSDRERRRKARQPQTVPRTPIQQRVLVPDIGTITTRRPSSIFGPRTGRWYPRQMSPGAGGEDCSIAMRCRSCKGCHRYRRASPCHYCEYSSPRQPVKSPSPTRRIWTSQARTHRPRSQQRVERPPASFVVLTDKVEINNNHQMLDGDLVEMERGGGRCCKEQKWMPPWYEPPM